MTNIILFGPPGSGKGTQSKRLIEKYGLFHVSTGELFRAQITAKTPLGKKIEETVSGGGLVEDAVTIAVLQDTLRQHMNFARGFLFDGFPRTHDQAVALNDIVHKEKLTIHAAVLLNVPEEELRKRILRRKNAEARADDDEEKLKKRIKVFFDETTQAFPLYASEGKLITVNGADSEARVFEKICAAIDSRI